MTSTSIHQELLEQEEKQNRIKGIIGTLIAHALLLLLIWQLAFTNNPPLPEQAGIPVDFGTSDVGSGDVIPETTNPIVAANNTPIPPEQQTAPPVVAPNDNNIATQDNEDAAAVKTNDKKKEEKQPVKETVKQPVKEPVKEQPKKDIPPAPPVPEKKPELIKGTTMGKPGTKNTSGSNGNDAPGTVGDKGVPWGSQSKDNFKGNDGKGDHGTGTGAKDVPGDDKYTPMKFYLTGRNLIKKPKPTSNIQESGTVVVTITVDRKGNVINTDCCSAKGTTTKNQALIGKALEAARDAKFDANPDAAETQIGTFTFTFKLE